MVDEIMDKFTKYALITLFAILAIMTIGAYIGYMMGGNAATDDIVNDLGGGGTVYSPFTIDALGENGEYIGFFFAGAIGGFIVGYLLPSVMNKNTRAGGAN
jgi:hypothetical protein